MPVEAKMEIGQAEPQNNIYNLLRNQILDFTIEPGDRLSENSLSLQMNAGRAQVREALSRLVEEGYIVVYPQRGTVASLLDPERIKQAVFSHVVIGQEVVKEVCGRGLDPDQRRALQEALENQNSKTGQDGLLELIAAENQISYLLSAFCKRESVWDFFRTMDCDLLRISCLQYKTFNYKIYMSSLTSWEHTQVENRLFLDHLFRNDADAAALMYSNHYNSLLWNMDTLRGIYPQYFVS